MGLETAVYISDLNSANPLSSDPRSEGDDHLRLLKAVLKATFPNITGPITLTQAQINALTTAYAALGGNASQAFMVAAATAANQAVNKGQMDTADAAIAATVDNLSTLVASYSGAKFFVNQFFPTF